jgi:ketosteroid isomerase-like protein
MKKTLLFLLLLLALTVRVEAQPPQSKEAHDELFRTISSLDAEVFDAYNRCDLEKLATYFIEDLEFYHDQSGLSRTRKEMIDGVRKYVCGKARRDLVPGTLEVYPLNNYGAVEIGSHRFCDPKKFEKCGEQDSGIAKFVMIWQHQDGGAWKITRVISFDHVSSK